MNILYAVQATGNGHLSRAREVLPILREYADVDVAVSGTAGDLKLPGPVAYEFEGLSFSFGKSGGVDLFSSARTILSNAFRFKLIREIAGFRLDNYDLVVNDFEPVTAWAAKFQGAPSVSFSHQASFLSSNTPRPEKTDPFAELVMRHYAPCSDQVGFHFAQYDEFIHTPLVRSEVRNLIPTNDGHVTVYLPAYDANYLIDYFTQFPDTEWEVFTKHCTARDQCKNVIISPVNNEAYLASLASSDGVLMGAGFEGPSEALFLGKKLMVVPMVNQYEQQCNARALNLLGVPSIPRISEQYLDDIRDWRKGGMVVPVNFPEETEEIVRSLILDLEQNPVLSMGMQDSR